MADRRRRPHRELNPSQARRAGAGAWLLAVLAGTPLAAGQFDLQGSGAPAPDPQDLAQADQPMRDPLAGSGLDSGSEVKVNEHLIVELHVKDEDLANVLQMLSIQSQINIIASRNVSATVSADLYGATFFEALDAILHVNGYGYVEKGNFIYVYTADELQAIQEANRKTVNNVIRLDYLNASDAAEFAKPLLSDKGEITAPGVTPEFALATDAPSGKDDYALSAILVVNDYEENVEQIVTLIKELDTRPAQVLVEATVLETTLTEDNSFGIDFTVLGSLDMEDFTGIGGPLKAVESLFKGQGKHLVGGSPVAVEVPGDKGGGALTSTVGQSQGPGGLKVGVVAGDVAAFLKVLDEVTDLSVISRPNILTLNRQPARVLVGTKVGYLSSTATSTSTTQTVQFLDTGTQLYFRPFVSRDGMIRMELKPSVSNATVRAVTDSGGSTVTIPDENTSELSTNVIVRDGNTIVLGGLFTESTRAARRQVPFLGDLPVVGTAFRGRDDSIDRSEIIFMIKPTIVNDQLMAEQGDRANNYVNHTRAGAREGLLIWSRERQSARLLVEADRKERAGDLDGALYCVERSLGINRAQPEAIAMRERLTSKKRVHPTRSKLDIIINNESDKGLVPAMIPSGPMPAAARFGLNSSGAPTTPATASADDGRQGALDSRDAVAPPPDTGRDDATGRQEQPEHADRDRQFREQTSREQASRDAAARQWQAQQAQAHQDLLLTQAELDRVNQELIQSRQRLAATQRSTPETAPVNPPQGSINAPLEFESKSAGIAEVSILPDDFPGESAPPSTGSPSDEAAFFNAWNSPANDARAIDTLSDYDSDQVDILIDDIAADTFWRNGKSEKSSPSSASGRRGAPFLG